MNDVTVPYRYFDAKHEDDAVELYGKDVGRRSMARQMEQARATNAFN